MTRFNQTKLHRQLVYFFRWFTYIRIRAWYRNHPLGMKGFVTNKKGRPSYCYKCGNFSNHIIKKHYIFTVPICRPHLDGTK